MREIIISVASPIDAAAIRRVQHDTWITTYPNEEFGITLDTITQRVSENFSAESIINMEEIIADPQKRTWVAKNDDTSIAYCVAAKYEDNNQLEALYVLSEFQGKNIGGLLMEKMLEWLGNQKPVVAEVASYNLTAIRFYEKYNFHKNGQTGDSNGIPTVNMVKTT